MPDSPVDALLFDLGGVVIDVDFGRAFAAWSRISRLSEAEIAVRYAFDDAYKAHERGELDGPAYLRYLRERLELEGDDSAIVDGWNAILGEEIVETTTLIARVATRIPCHLFSNTNELHRTAWTERLPRLLDPFDRVFLSHRMGRRKPDVEAFEHIGHDLGLALDRILFFDDTPPNVAGARAAGLRAVQVDGPADVASTLQALGLDTDGIVTDARSG